MSMRVCPSDISFVVQGPVEQSKAVSTRQVCSSIRRFFPGAEIIVSTWDGADTRSLDADQFVFSQDPGTLSDDLNANLNRLLVSSKEGISRATRPLIMKTRSDVRFTSDSVLDYWDRWNDYAPDLRLFRKRVLVPNTFTVRPSYYDCHAFQPSDWCFLGLREDIEFLFDVPLCSLEQLLVPTPPDPVVFWGWSEPCTAHQTNEQYLWLNALRKRFPALSVPLRLHLTPKLLVQTELTFANNLVVLDAATQYGIFAPKHPNAGTGPNAHRLLSHHNWQGFYQAYCANASPALPSCTLDDLRAAKDDYSGWTEDDPRFIALRRAGHAWEAMLLECALRARRSGMSPCRPELVTNSAQAQGLWAEAHLADCLTASAAVPASAAPLSSATSSPVNAQAAQNETRGRTPASENMLLHAPDMAAWQRRTAGRFAAVCTRIRPDQPLTKQWLQDLAQQTGPDTRFIVFLDKADNLPAWMPAFLQTRPDFLVAQASCQPDAAIWNFCLQTFDSDCVVFVGQGDLLKHGGIQELTARMRAFPQIGVGRAALAQSSISGAKEFFPLLPDTTVLGAAEAITNGLQHGEFTRSPSVQIFRRDIALQMPALCDIHLAHYALDDFALRLAARNGLVWCGGSFGVRPSHAAVFLHDTRPARFQEECAFKIRLMRELLREQTMEYNQPFTRDVCRQINMLYLNDHSRAKTEEEKAELKRVYQQAIGEMRGVSHDLAVHKHGEAMACYERGEIGRAVSLLQSLVKEAFYFGPAHNDLSVLLHTQKNHKLALEHSKCAVALKPDDPDAVRNMALLLALNGRKADAERACQRLLALSSSDVSAHAMYAVLPSNAPTADTFSRADVSAAAA